MEETATLLIRVQSDQADAAKSKLKQLGFAAKEAETATGGLMAAWKGLGAILTGAASLTTAIAGLNKLKDVAKQFESLEAQLKTATGSAENAKNAFSAIQDFARQTPYDLAQSTEAFIKLVNLGMDPSERALRSYGDTASAMGRQLSDMITAVSRAATGEFEPLKSFGVKARQEADGLTFTFRGVTTKVGNSAKEIEKYFIELGEKNFAGAMAERMATLEGKLSNLGDAWDFLFATIAKNGAGDLMKEGIDVAIDAITELTDLIASGELSGYVDALLYKFGSLADGVVNAMANVSSVLEMVFEYWATDGKGAVDFIIDAFKNLPENIRAMAQGIGATVALVYESAVGSVKMYIAQIENFFNYLVETATNVGKEIWDQLSNPLSKGKFDYVAAQTAAFQKFGDTAKNAWDKAVEGTNNATAAWEEEISAIMDERDVSLATFKAKIEGAKQLRAEYEKLKAAREASTGEKKDRLANFRVNSEETSAEFRRLVEDLRTQEQALAESYKKRKALILGNTKEGSELQMQLIKQLDERFAEERKSVVDRLGYNVGFNADKAQDDLALEMAALDDAYAQKQKQLQDALDAKLITEREYTERSLAEEKRHARESEAIERAKQKARLSLASDFFGNLATIASVFGARGARIAKAAAIIQTTIKTYESATSAYASLAGIPYVGPALGAVAAAAAIAAGMANIAMIKSQNYSGAYAGGGMIPAGKWGIAQEAGAEIVHGPAVVTSARATADLQGGNSGTPNVVVNIKAGPGVEVQQTGSRMDGDTNVLDFVAQQMDRRAAAGVREGTSLLAQELARQGMRRGVA